MVLPLLQELAARTAPQGSNPYTHINCVANAAGFFNNVRTPASLLVIPAINSLWLDLSSTTKRTKHPVAQTLFTLSVMLSVLLELVCVFVATVAGTRLLSGGFDPMGPDAVTLLVREFELDYLATHLTFIFGLVAFMSSIGLRAFIQFGDSQTASRMGRAYTILTSIFIMNMAAYFHSSVAPFHLGLPGLIIRFLVLYLQNFGMLGVISLAAVGTVGYLVHAIHMPYTCRRVVARTGTPCTCTHTCILMCMARARHVCTQVYQTLRDQLVTHGAPTAQLSVQDLPRVEHGEKWKNWQPDRKNK